MHSQGRISNSWEGVHTNEGGGPFLLRGANILFGVHFSSPKVDDLFSPNVYTYTKRGKKLQSVAPPPAAGAPFHGTTGTMVNPALCTVAECRHTAQIAYNEQIYMGIQAIVIVSTFTKQLTDSFERLAN